MRLAGTPEYRNCGSQLFVTTAPAAITQPCPIVTPGKIMTPAPIQAPSRIFTSALVCLPLRIELGPISWLLVTIVTFIANATWEPIVTGAEQSMNTPRLINDALPTVRLLPPIKTPGEKEHLSRDNPAFLRSILLSALGTDSLEIIWFTQTFQRMLRNCKTAEESRLISLYL